ncbi:MAG: alkaline phosphatase family protein [Candidatus Cybelea sp.]|jgi:phospholipase C
MNRIMYSFALVAVAVASLAACGAPGATLTPSSSFGSASSAGRNSRPPNPFPIQHVVLMIQENRSFNDLFATFPGAVGTTTGFMRSGSGKKAQSVPVALTKVPLLYKLDLNHVYPAWLQAYRNGNMDGFNLIQSGASGQPEGTKPYQYVDPMQIQSYWALARQYVLADHMFQTQGSGSFTAHQDLIRGATDINTNQSLIDYPTGSPWGCNAPPNTQTSLITTSLQYLKNKGPYPCLSYDTLQNLLDAKGVSWKYYTPSLGATGSLWNAFLAINSVYSNKSEWNAHISSPETSILTDISNGTLPQMSWVIPDALDSDHPDSPSDNGPSWIASVVNAVGESTYWDSTAIVVVWDDWGGFYDPVRPPKRDEQGGPGFRVPAIIISPYVPSHKVAHTVFAFGSILRFVEDAFRLGRLGTTDSTSTSIETVFDFGQKPRSFKMIPSARSREYFLRRKPSNLPVDTQ